jgi:hypothetical protein
MKWKPMADINKIINAYSTNKSFLDRTLDAQMGSLKGTETQNFEEILKKYPGLSNDLVISMVQSGLTVNTPGIEKITTIDGLTALKANAADVQKIKSTVKTKRGVLGSMEDAFSKAVYAPVKGTTRLLFAALRSPYDAATTAVRDLNAVAQGKMDVSQLVKDVNPITGGLFGETTTLGQVIRKGNSGTGAGFFVAPESTIGKAQAKAMGAYGKVNGESFTIGRGLFNGVGMNPSSNAYHVMSGILDATLNVALDPSTWFGPGALGKTITSGKKATQAIGDVFPSTKAYYDNLTREGIKDLEDTNQIVVDKLNKKISSPFKRIAGQVKSKEQEIIAVDKQLNEQQMGVAQKLLNSEKKYFGLKPTTPEVKAALSPKAIADWFVSNPKTQTGELTKAMDLLSADMKNTSGFFHGHVILDEVPQYGKISAGAHGLDEYVVTANSTKEFKLLDMADDFTKADPAVRQEEMLRRSKFADTLDKLGKNAADPDFRIYNELATSIRNQSASLDGFVGSLYSVGDELVAGKSLGTLIGEIAAYKNPAVMAKITDSVEKIWKVDGFSNIRSIYGKTGGVVITKAEKIAATRAEVGNAAAEFADPTNLGPNVMKLLESVQDTKASLAARQNELDDLANKQLDLEDKENWFKLLREKANGDPEILKELIQDPNNAGIKNLLKLEAEVANNTVMKESLRAQIGITDGFMGNIGDDFSKPLKFILGRQFQPVAELIAKETDPVRLRNLFGRKLDDNMVMELVDAQSADDVFKVFLNQMVPGADLNKIKNSLSTGVKIATSPVARLAPSVNLRAVQYAENINKAFGRYYIRSTAVDLHNTTALNNTVEDWISSIGLTSKFGKIIPKGIQEGIIADTQRAIFRATTTAEKAAAVQNGISNLIGEVGKAISLSKEQIDSLRNVSKIRGNDEALIQSYALEGAIRNDGASILKTGGTEIELPGAFLESQLVHDVINLPDTRELNKAIVAYKTNLPLFGTAKSTKLLLEQAGDLWRTAQLVGRFSYVVRNVAEMQMRQFFSGHYSIFNSPIGFISMVMADPKGNIVRRNLAKGTRYGVNVMGESLKEINPEEVEYSASVIARLGLMRGTESVGDYGSQARKGTLFKSYESITPEHPEFLKALSWTINSFSNDRFMPDVVRIMQKGTKEAQIEYVDNLIATFDEPGNKLKELASAIFKDNKGMREVLLKNPFPETGPGVIADNMNKDNILTWLFDATQERTVAGQLNILGGQGSKRNVIMDLIRDGEIKVTSAGGKPVTVRTPYRQTGLTTEQVLRAEQVFGKQVNALFKPEELNGSIVKNITERYVGNGAVSKAKELTDKFFAMAARMESKFNFGPEFDASYWDFAAGYADMLSTKDLGILLKNAKKTFRPMATKNGLPAFGRVPGPLKTINNLYKKRLANPESESKAVASLRNIDNMAADHASEHVKNLFYDAAKQKQWANAARLVAPFAQAHYNTISKWAELTRANPVPMIKFGKTFDALTKPGSGVIYDTSGMTYDDQQGFFYKDEGQNQYKFKMPIVGNVIGAMVGRNLNMKDALQITSPVESLNLAFGSVNPVLPGVGPAMVALYELTGRASAFGPVDDLLRDIVTPFGEPKSVGDIVFPSWLKKIGGSVLGTDASTQRGVKDWAAYLASTGNPEYGDNPLASDATRNKLFSDAQALSKWANVFGGIIQSIAPATPVQEVLASIKNPNNKMNFMTMTMVYKEWDAINKKHPGDRNAAVTEFADKFGANNLLVAVSGTTPGSTGSTDAWTWLNNNPDLVSKYATKEGDVTPYFFPGGEFSLKYYNWQLKTGSRTKLYTSDIKNEAENLVYSMLKSQLAEKQIAGGYTDFWYNEQLAMLDKEFTSRPADTIITNINDNKIANIELALQEPAFQKSPVYKQTAEFYSRFKDLKKTLNDLKVTNYAELSSKGGVPTLMRNELVTLGEKLILENPEFARMYYGVFAGILKEAK